MQAKTYKGMSSLSREDLITLYDRVAQSNGGTIVGLDFIKQEIWRRDAEQFNQRVDNMTNEIRWLTRVITLLTISNVGMIVYSIFFQ